jgi:hypothetical protein
MKLTYSEAEEVAYENGVLDAIAMMEEELAREITLSPWLIDRVKARVSARLLDTN